MIQSSKKGTRWKGWRTSYNQSTTGSHIGFEAKKVKSRKKKKKVSTTEKQRRFIHSLNKQLGKNWSVPNNKQKASDQIQTMLGLVEQKKSRELVK